MSDRVFHPTQVNGFSSLCTIAQAINNMTAATLHNFLDGFIVETALQANKDAQSGRIQLSRSLDKIGKLNLDTTKIGADFQTASIPAITLGKEVARLRYDAILYILDRINTQNIDQATQETLNTVKTNITTAYKISYKYMKDEFNITPPLWPHNIT